MVRPHVLSRLMDMQSAVCGQKTHHATTLRRHALHYARKLMGTGSQPHVHEAWGILHTAQQMLVALHPERTHHQQEALEDALHAAGGYVSTYLPDHTWLVVGNAHVADAARAHPLVTWVVRFTNL